MTEDEENLNATNDELHTTTNPTTSKDLRDPPQLEKINRTRNVVVDYSKKNYLTTDDNLYKVNWHDSVRRMYRSESVFFE